MRSTWIAWSAALLLLGCGGGFPPPSERLAQAESSSRGARELGADQEPTAALHLKMANDQIKQGKDLMAAGENRRADALFIRANADAELALQIAKATKTRAEADEVLAKVKTLRTGK